MIKSLHHSIFDIQHWTFSFVVFLCLPSLWLDTSLALDVGPPVYRGDVDGLVTMDIVYERLNRDIEQQIAFSEATFFAEQEENRLVSRLFFYPTSRLTLQVSLGFTDADNSIDFAPLYGGGVQARLAELGPLTLNGFLGGYYVDEIEYETPGLLTFTVELPSARRSESYYDVGGALTLSVDYDLNADLRVLPYAGVVASKMDAEGEETFTIFTTGETQSDRSVDFEDDSPVSAVAGLLLQVRRNFGARFEGRFIGQSSYTAGLFFSF